VNRVQQLRQRLTAARARLERIPAGGPDALGVYGAPDPASGERWHRGNVLGHVAEMLPFWTAQCRAVVSSGARAVGRDEVGTAARRSGIERGAEVPEAQLRAVVVSGIAELDEFLGTVSGDDLGRRIVYRASSGEREMSLGDLVEANLVGHLEGHLDQLEELTP
jgi:DinB superfamily